MPNSSFSHSYQWQILGGFPSNLEIANYPPNVRQYSEGFIVKVEPKKGRPWIGNFQGGPAEYLTGVYPTPNEDILCIISGGDPYLVNSVTPDDFIELPIGPVIEVRSLPEHDLLILIDFTRVTAIDTYGVRWKVEVSRDGIKIIEITNEKIIGLAWDPARGVDEKFEVSLKTGQHLGGTSY